MERKELKPYSPEYWQAALAEVDRPVHRCCKCFRTRGEVVNVKRNGLAHGSDPSVRRIEVRLVDVDGAPQMACTKCVPAPKEPKRNGKPINEPAPSLFPEEPASQK